MACIKEFKAIRPDREYAEKVAALPYDVYTTSEARRAVEDNPYSFLHVDRAEVDLPEDVDKYSDEVYKKAKSNLESLIDKKILVQDTQNCLYIYRLTSLCRTQTGLVCLSSIDDYLSGVIKKHELTREDKELDRIKHVDICNAHTGPIFLTYKSKKSINQIVDSWIENNEKEYEFESEDGIKHEVWVIDNSPTISTLKNLFSEIPNTYIADGHHRAASAVKVGLKRRESDPDYNGAEEYNYFLSVIFPHDQLCILDYNRVVKNLNGLTKEEFLNRLKTSFSVQKSDQQVKPEKKGVIGMFLEGQWYRLSIKDEYLPNDLVGRLDVSILQNEILTPILGIRDVRNDDRIDFVGGARGLDELERRCHDDMKVAFSMYPTTIEELMEISDEDSLMPPKSTWFEPKLRSGLFIHSLS